MTEHEPSAAPATNAAAAPAPGTPSIPAHVGNGAVAGSLAGFYGAVFLVVGLYMPFWPVWLEQARGLSPSQIGLVLGLTTWTTLLSNPVAAHLADRSGRRRPVLIVLAIGATACSAAYGITDSLWSLMAVAVAVGLFFPPLIPLGENMALLAIRTRNLHYGRIRLWGSVTFIIASWGGGLWLAGRDVEWVFWMLMAAYGLMIIACLMLPDVRVTPSAARAAPIRTLLTQPSFVVFMITGGLIQGSHAAFYGFATIHWYRAGISEFWIGFLWAEGVVAEILLFTASAWLIRRVGFAGLLMMGAGFGVVRWSLTALTTDLGALALLQPLHAFTFAATHLGAMHFIQRYAPPGSTATAQSLYSALAIGAVLAAVTMVTGLLYQLRGAEVFLLMAIMALGGFIGCWFLSAIVAAQHPTPPGDAANAADNGGVQDGGVQETEPAQGEEAQGKEAQNTG